MPYYIIIVHTFQPKTDQTELIVLQLHYGGGGVVVETDVSPFSYRDIASVGTVPYLDVITSEEAASLVRKTPLQQLSQP